MSKLTYTQVKLTKEERSTRAIVRLGRISQRRVGIDGFEWDLAQLPAVEGRALERQSRVGQDTKRITGGSSRFVHPGGENQTSVRQ